MIDTVIFDKDGLKGRKWENKKYKIVPIDPDYGIAQYLECKVDIGVGLTLLSLFEFLYRGANNDEVEFIGSKAHCNFGPFYKEMLEEPKKEEKDGYLLLKREIEITKDYGSGSELSMATDLTWVNKGENYAMDFTPLNEIRNLPIKVCHNAELWDWRTKKVKSLGNVVVPITLGDLFHGILWEISFHGTPEKREATLADLNQRRKDVDSGKVKLIPWEVVKKKLERKIKRLKNDR
jgi:hypothetical protein